MLDVVSEAKPNARKVIRERLSRYGQVRPKELTEIGIDPSCLRRMVAKGELQRVAQGVYTRADFEPTESHTLVRAVQSQTKSVVCLLSALSFHQIGTQLPSQVWLAVPYGTRIAKASYPPRRVVVLRTHTYEAGIESHTIEGIEVPIYSIPKTVADCFKFRNTIGLDVAIEALRETLQERRCTREEIRKYAKINRVERVMQPFLEALALAISG